MDDKVEGHKLETLTIHLNPPDPFETVAETSPSTTAMHHPVPTQSYPTNATTPHHDGRIMLYNEGREQADEDIASTAAGASTFAPLSEQSETEHDVSFREEDFKRNVNAIATDRNGNEHLVPAAALYDSGCEKVNVISGRLARKLNIEPEPPSCPPGFLSRVRQSRFLRRISSKLKIGKGKVIEDIRSVDGSRVRHQRGPVFVEWQCLDPNPRRHQHLFFDPKTYRTKHIIVENAAADLIFSRRTWLEENLTEPSVCALGVGRRIGEKPKASTDQQGAQKDRDERARVMKKRNEEMDKRVKSGFQSTSGQSASNGGKTGPSGAP